MADILHRNTVAVYTATGLRPLLCLFPPEDQAIAAQQGPLCTIVLDGAIYYLPAAVGDRADGISFDRIYQAGLDLLAVLPADREVLSCFGMTKQWEEDFRFNLNAAYDLWRAQTKARNLAEMERALGQGLMDKVQAQLRWGIGLARSAGLGWAFDMVAADRQSLPGLRLAVIDFNDRAESPEVRRRLLQAGATEEQLQELSRLEGELRQERESRAVEAAAARLESEPLRVGKRLLLGDLSIVANRARTALPPERWEAYQIGRLLGLSPRPAEKEREPGDEDGPVPAPPRAPGLPRAPGTPPVAGPPPARPAGTAPARPGTTLPVAGSAPGAAGSAPGAAGSAPGAGAAPAADAGRPAPEVVDTVGLSPGTELYRIRAAGGPDLVAVVGEDHKVAWVPVGTLAGPAGASARPGATRPAAPATDAPPPATPAKRRTRGRAQRR
jgi:hypothetical protein